MALFDIHFIIITIFDYKLSLLELIGTVSGMLCVWLTAREKVSCWPIGIVNILFFFVMFYQVQLYSDMILQIFFLIMTVYGWWKWTHPRDESENNGRNELKISTLTPLILTLVIVFSGAGVFGLGTFMKHIHELLPLYFPKAAAFPYPDAFTTIFSITANLLMTIKKRECWILWIIVDIVSFIMYFLKGINLVAIEYVIFAIIALMGWLNWTREEKSYKQGPMEEEAQI
jgi:nicotinamide mononucleotide transporter